MQGNPWQPNMRSSTSTQLTVQKCPTSACLAWRISTGIITTSQPTCGNAVDCHNWVVCLSPGIQLLTDDGFHLHKGVADVDCSLRKKTQLVFNPECTGLTFQAYLDIAADITANL